MSIQSNRRNGSVSGGYPHAPSTGLKPHNGKGNHPGHGVKITDAYIKSMNEFKLKTEMDYQRRTIDEFLQKIGIKLEAAEIKELNALLDNSESTIRSVLTKIAKQVHL